DALHGATGYHEQADEPQEHFPSGAAQDAYNVKSCTCYRHKSTPLPATATPTPAHTRKGEDERTRSANPQPPPTLDRSINERSTPLRAATSGPHQCNTTRGVAPASARGQTRK